MNWYKRQFQEHPVQKVLDGFEQDIKNTKLTLDELDERAAYARFRRAIRMVRHALRAVDPTMVTAASLNEVEAVAADLREQYRAFCSDRNWRALGDATDAMLNQVFRLRPWHTDGNGREAFAQVEDYRELVEQHLSAIKAQADELCRHFDSSRHELESIGERLREQDHVFEQQKGRLDSLISDQQSRFAQAEQDRTGRFQDEQGQRGRAFDELRSDLQQQSSDFLEQSRIAQEQRAAEQNRQSQTHLSTLEEHEEHARRIVGVVGNIGVTGNYQKIADREWAKAELFRWLTVGFFGLMGVVVLIIVFSVGVKDFNWEVALFRLGVAVTLIAPAIYCAKESSKHRALETRNRRIELELASLRPFLEDLPGKTVEEITAKLAEQYFGKGLEAVNGDAGDEALGKLRDLKGEDVLKFIQQVARAASPK